MAMTMFALDAVLDEISEIYGCLRKIGGGGGGRAEVKI